MLTSEVPGAGVDRRRPDAHRIRVGVSIMQLLLDDPRLDLDALDWAAVRAIAERHGVIVRVAKALEQRHEAIPKGVADAAARAAARTQRVVALVDRLTDACNTRGIAHAFLGVVDRYPDSGPDIDLLIAEPSPSVDRLLLEAIHATPRAHHFRDRLSGSRTYTASTGIVIDLHHARLGQFGEQARYARILLSRVRPSPLGLTQCLAPAAEDQLVLSAIRQAYRRPALRISDVFGAMSILRSPETLNLDYLFATALSTDALPALAAYLTYIDGMHNRLFGRRLLASELLARFTGGWRVSARDEGVGRFPATSMSRRLYLSHVQAALEAGRWHSMARLLLLPVVAAFSATTRLRTS